MPQLIVTGRDGAEHRLEGPGDQSVMEAIRDGGVSEVLALCGGCRSCATCHVHVDPTFFPMLAPMSEDESDLLDGSPHRTATSRLSCQIRFEERLDGLRVTVAEED